MLDLDRDLDLDLVLDFDLMLDLFERVDTERLAELYPPFLFFVYLPDIFSNI